MSFPKPAPNRDPRSYRLVTAAPRGERVELAFVDVGNLIDINPPVHLVPPGTPLLVHRDALAQPHERVTRVVVAPGNVIPDGLERVGEGLRLVVDRAWATHAHRQRSSLPTPLLAMRRDAELPLELSELRIIDGRVVPVERGSETP